MVAAEKCMVKTWESPQVPNHSLVGEGLRDVRNGALSKTHSGLAFMAEMHRSKVIHDYITVIEILTPLQGQAD